VELIRVDEGDHLRSAAPESLDICPSCGEDVANALSWICDQHAVEIPELETLVHSVMDEAEDEIVKRILRTGSRPAVLIENPSAGHA